MRKWLLTGLCCASLLTQAHAQSLPETLSLDEWLELVAQHNTELQTGALHLDIARSQVSASRALPNPSISYNREGSEEEYMIEQEIPLFGQRNRRIQTARSELAATHAQRDLTQLDVLHDAAARFMHLQIAQQRELQQQQLLEATEQATRVIEGQFEAGLRSEYDRIRMHIELTARQNALEESQIETRNTRMDLAELIAKPDWQPRAANNSIHSIKQLPAAVRPTSELPTVRMALAEESVNQQKLREAQREVWPAPSINVGTVRDDNMRENVIGVSMTLPLFDRNRGAISAARLEAREATLRRVEATHLSELQWQKAHQEWQQRQTMLVRFEQQILPTLPRLRTMAEDAWRLGENSVLEMLDTLQQIADIQNDYLDLLEATSQAELDLQKAAGYLPAWKQAL